MHFKVLSGLFLAGVLSTAAFALAGGFSNSPATVTSNQPCCTLTDCCPECIACCAIDGCCEECIQCCIEMGCDPSCCLPAATANAESKTCKPSVGCTGGSCCK